MTLSVLFSPFQHLFMIEAMVVAALIGGVCAVLSCYLVLKGWSLMGDAVAHSVLPGIVVAYFVGIPLAVGAFCSGLLCAVSTGWIKGNSRIKEDTVMGVVFTGLFAIGLVLFTKIQTDVHLNHILFGSLLGIERHDLIQAVVTSVITLVAMLVLRKDLLLYLFDSHQAKASGLNPTFLHYSLLSLLAATIVAALQAVGIILTVAMLITPGCIAFLMTDRFDKMLWVAALSAIGSSVVGTYISYFLNGSTGACIVLSQAMVFVLALLFSRKQGLINASAARRAPHSQVPEKKGKSIMHNIKNKRIAISTPNRPATSLVAEHVFRCRIGNKSTVLEEMQNTPENLCQSLGKANPTVDQRTKADRSITQSFEKEVRKIGCKIETGSNDTLPRNAFHDTQVQRSLFAGVRLKHPGAIRNVVNNLEVLATPSGLPSLKRGELKILFFTKFNASLIK